MGLLACREAPREAKVKWGRLELTNHFNAKSSKGWHPATNVANQEDNSLINLPLGVQTLADVPFEIRDGLIQLTGRSLENWGKSFPREIKGIKVHRTCRRVHFLQGTGWQEPDGAKIGHYLIHYKNGPPVEVPIIYGSNVRDWWFWANEPQTSSHAALAWTGSNVASEKAKMSLRLYRDTWDNPQPKDLIESIDFVSAGSNCAPFLIAITVEE